MYLTIIVNFITYKLFKSDLFLWFIYRRLVDYYDIFLFFFFIPLCSFFLKWQCYLFTLGILVRYLKTFWEQYVTRILGKNHSTAWSFLHWEMCFPDIRGWESPLYPFCTFCNILLWRLTFQGVDTLDTYILFIKIFQV